MEMLRKLLRPELKVTLFISLSAAALLILCLNGSVSAPAVHYFAYLYSTYALIIVCARAPEAAGRLRAAFSGALDALAASHPRAGNIFSVLSDPEERVRALLLPTLVFNLAYAAFKLAAGVYLSSYWVFGTGAYYAVLACARFFILRSFVSGRREHGWRTYRGTALLLLALTLVIAGLNAQMVFFSNYFSYPGAMIYAFALYAFIKICTASAAVIRKRHEENALLAASRCVSFACALVSMLFLQTALLGRFGDGGAFTRTANIMMGSFVVLAMLVICAHMFARSRRRV